jgi:hypothetical protein
MSVMMHLSVTRELNRSFGSYEEARTPCASKQRVESEVFCFSHFYSAADESERNSERYDGDDRERSLMTPTSPLKVLSRAGRGFMKRP